MIPLSLTKKKFFLTLSTVKHRRKSGLYGVEGVRALEELIGSAPHTLQAVVVTENAMGELKHMLPDDCDVYVASAGDMRQLSMLSTPSDVIGYFTVPPNTMPSVQCGRYGLLLALDGVQDPGNVGTILRLADWWGVENVVCSDSTADWLNAKVVQSAMGALGRVKVSRTAHLATYLREAASAGCKVYGANLRGDNIYKKVFDQQGILVMGNEGNGISPEVNAVITDSITIPSYPQGNAHVESLNVATAAAIILSRIRSFAI